MVRKLPTRRWRHGGKGGFGQEGDGGWFWGGEVVYKVARVDGSGVGNGVDGRSGMRGEAGRSG